MRSTLRNGMAAILWALAVSAHAEARGLRFDFMAADPTTVRSIVDQISARIDPRADNCDSRQFPQMLEIAAALDARSGEIAAYTNSLPPSEHYRRVPFGPIIAREIAVPFKDPPGWWVDRYGWGDYFKEYEAVKENPTPKGWHDLDADVRGILFDDLNRLIFRSVTEFGHSDFGKLREIQAKLRACYPDENCTDPGFSVGARDLLRNHPMTMRTFEDFEKAGGSARRTPILNLQYLVGAIAIPSDTRRNAAVRREGSVLVLPLYAGDFTPVKELIRKRIESIWKSPDLRVRVEWRDSPTGVYRFEIGRATSGRPYTDYQSKTIVLFPDVRMESIAHEIGHVLGIDDHYYTHWNSRTCGYETDMNSDDVMSDSPVGGATPEDWKYLRSIYPDTASAVGSL